MIQYFSSSPEATVAIIIFVLGLGWTIVTILSPSHPVIVRLLASHLLAFADSALQNKVKITFTHLNQTIQIFELRQIELEVFNSHPRQKLTATTIAINLQSDKIQILGVSAANINNQLIAAGGREITTVVVKTPTDVSDPLLGSASGSFYPVIAVTIPYLDRVAENDRVFLRITYSGPALIPMIQGAQLRKAGRYQIGQYVSWVIIAIILAIFTSNSQYSMLTGATGVLVIIMSIILFFYESKFKKYMRTLPNVLIPPPYRIEDLINLRYHDTMRSDKPLDTQ